VLRKLPQDMSIQQDFLASVRPQNSRESRREPAKVRLAGSDVLTTVGLSMGVGGGIATANHLSLRHHWPRGYVGLRVFRLAYEEESAKVSCQPEPGVAFWLGVITWENLGNA
jgi:hypothetical protein